MLWSLSVVSHFFFSSRDKATVKQLLFSQQPGDPPGLGATPSVVKELINSERLKILCKVNKQKVRMAGTTTTDFAMPLPTNITNPQKQFCICFLIWPLQYLVFTGKLAL